MSDPNFVSRPAIETMMSHVSVRAFTDEPVEPALIERLVKAGVRASTSSNMQAYTIISIADSALKERLGGLCGDQVQVHESAAFLVFCADLHKLELCSGMHGVDAAPAGEAEALLIAVIDTALVMQNVAVAAESLDLGICMIGAIRNHPRAVAEALHLPPRVMAVSGMCIGRPAQRGDVKPRFPLDATLHYNRYRRDEELQALIGQYDRTQAEWYAERDMHPRDSRWSAVIARRLAAVAKRSEVGTFLAEQGFLI